MPRDTVFSPSFGNRPAYLVGRDGLIDDLMNGLQEAPGNRERAVVLLGQRGSGKTVLLWELADRARQLGFVVASPTIATDGMLERVVEKIQDDGERYSTQRKTHLVGGSIGAFGFSAGLEFSRDVQEQKSASYKLTQLARRLTEQGCGILILIDELQANSPEIRNLVITYQELVGERLNVALFMAGLPGAVSATLNDKVLTFLNRARKRMLDPLSYSDTDAFYMQAFKTLDLQVSEQQRSMAVKATQGSPYLLQLIGHNIVMQALPDGCLTDTSVSDAITAAGEDYKNDVCETTLAALSGQDVAFLIAMAKGDELCRVSDIAEQMGVSTDYAQKYRRRLIDSGVIEVPMRGFVRFAIPYLGEYLREVAR